MMSPFLSVKHFSEKGNYMNRIIVTTLLILVPTIIFTHPPEQAVEEAIEHILAMREAGEECDVDTYNEALWEFRLIWLDITMNLHMEMKIISGNWPIKQRKQHSTTADGSPWAMMSESSGIYGN